MAACGEHYKLHDSEQYLELKNQLRLESMKTTKVLLIASATICATLPVGLLAADAVGDESGLTEIVVTAQKRAEDVDKVPISMSVFNQQMMDRQGVRDLVDVLQFVPGVNYQATGPLNDLSIRGISSGTGASTTGVYIDDVPIQVRFPIFITGAAVPAVFDLDRVEVLRGPQGTYFGSAAEAGVIRFISVQPSVTESTGYTREGFNGVNNGGIGYEAGVAVGGPIIEDELGYRVSVNHERDAGWVDHYSNFPTPGGVEQADSNWSDTDQIKGALLIQPTASVKITPQIFFQNIYTHDLSAYDPGPLSPGVALSDPSTDSYVNGGYLLTPNRDQIVLPQLKAEFQMGDVSLTSISAFLYREDRFTLDYTRIVPELLSLPNPTTASDPAPVPFVTLQKNVTQEIRLQNTDLNAKFKWTAGAWFSIAKQEDLENIVDANLNNYLLGAVGKNVVQLLGFPLVQPGNYSFVADNVNHDRQLAGFAQIDWEFLSHLTLTLGVRETKQSNNFNLFEEGPFVGAPILSLGGESEHVTTPKYGLSYQIDDKNLVYASVSKGNRIGGGNPPFFKLPGCLAALAEEGLPENPGAYKSDYVWNYEVGSKNRLFNDRVQIEASVFHMDWEALQQIVYVPACSISFTANVGKAYSNGFDLQIVAEAAHNLKLSMAIGYNNAKIGETTGVPHGLVYVNEGDQIDPTQSPWIIASAIQYDFKIFSTQPAYARLDNEYHSKNPGPYTFANPDATGYIAGQPVNGPQNLTNLRVGTIAHGWDVAVYGKNLANSHPLLNATLDSQFAAIGHDYTLTPRTVGVTANYHW